MAEDPIKLFSTRAERLPQPDDSQTVAFGIIWRSVSELFGVVSDLL